MSPALALRGLIETTPEAIGCNFNDVGDYAASRVRYTEEKQGTLTEEHRRELEDAGTVYLNGFITAFQVAYDKHFPLALSPDDVWLAVVQGLSTFVNANAGRFRSRFARHDGQMEIWVERNSFMKGSPENDWQGAFNEFSQKIGEQIGEGNRRLIVSDFSTTGPVERAASEIVLMDVMKAYFEYGVSSMCGIPEITLLGTVEDWRSMRIRAQNLAEYECEEWIESLIGVLDEFVAAVEGHPNIDFWTSFYKLDGGSGGPFVNGAINVFFPYVRKWRTGQISAPNERAINWSNMKGRGGGPRPDSFPSGVARVPFKWKYFTTEFPMDFIAGFMGANQNPDTGLMRPAIGWAVADGQEKEDGTGGGE
jgi:hypothetical protein